MYLGVVPHIHRKVPVEKKDLNELGAKIGTGDLSQFIAKNLLFTGIPGKMSGFRLNNDGGGLASNFS